MKNLFTRAAALLMVAAMLVVCFAGCGKEPLPAEADGKTVVYFAASHVTAQVQSSVRALVDTYNTTQGETDGIYVQLRENSGAISGLESALRSNYPNDVLMLFDNEFKTLAIQGQNYFVSLDSYLTEEVKTAMAWDEIPENLVNRFRINTTADSDGIYLAGEGASLLALPYGSDPQMLYYNKTILTECGINLISVPEAELEAYNTANSAKLMPHGYAEYKEEPFAGAKTSQNEAGEFVYKVFNDCIAMNWEEQRCLSRAFQQQYGKEYGYMSEWWFNYGFSVGGDCIGWNADTNRYEFTLADKQSGYLALADITVNGNAYKTGEVLLYEDKLFLNENAAEKDALSGKIYPLPAMYDAILEFTRMGVPAGKQVEDGIYGYGLAPSTTANRTQRFLSGKDCPLLIEDYSQSASFAKTLGDALGMAVPAQYREYAGGSTYEKDGKEYLKVIGETYDGQVYTGELHTEGGIAIVGEAATESSATGLFIPANTKSKSYDAAFKFAAWAAGPEGQKIMATGNAAVPNQTGYGLGDYADYTDDASHTIPNRWAGAYMAQNADIGDYTYFVSGTWITEWSLAFNQDVRGGNLMISDFIAQKLEAANHSLKGMTLRMLGR